MTSRVTLASERRRAEALPDRCEKRVRATESWGGGGLKNLFRGVKLRVGSLNVGTMKGNKIVKKTVAKAKAVAIDDLYDKLETAEGQKAIYRIAKARSRETKDFTHNRQMKGKNGVVQDDKGKIR